MCSDTDGDSCDDCASGTFDPSNDGTDTDSDGLCNTGDPDDDNDGVLDGDDPFPLDAPPSVSISSPINGRSVLYDSTVTIVVLAGDDIGVTQVEFFVNGVLIATDTSAPFHASFMTPPPPADVAQLLIEVVTTDGVGQTATDSIILNLTVAIPTVGEWGLIVMGLLLLIAVTFVTRRLLFMEAAMAA